jgi:hypothetical protein
VIVSCVLRASLSFGPEHVEWLGRQVAEHYPDATFLPFSDVPLRIPHERLVEGLPTWWSKMEAYRRLKEGTVLMLDIDTVLLRPIDIPVPPEGTAYMQSSPRNIYKLWGALQISSPEFRRMVTDKFFRDDNWLSRIKTLNAARPDAVVSYKLHVLHQGIRPENAFVMFHAQPRPWHAVESWIPPLFPPSEI